MPIVESELALLPNPQLAVLATSASPAWLWSADASRILWGNAVGAAMFGAADTNELGTRRFDATNPAAAQIIRLAATLPSADAPRLERLRGFGGGFGRALTCVCSRFVLPDGGAAVLVAASEPAGPTLSLSERVRRLFADDKRVLAVFTPDGTLLHATAVALAQLGGTTTLSALGIEAIAAQALKAGSASGAAKCGAASLERLGDDATRVLVLTLTPQPSEQHSETSVAENTEGARTASIPEVADVASPPSPATDAASAIAEPPRSQPPAQTTSLAEPTMERRHPLRFVWQMDADGRFVVGSDEFVELVGPRTMAGFGRLWSEIAADLKLDPDNQIGRAIATRETWSGITIPWPADETSERLPVELSGLPVFDRDRNFRGYRGFGVCRDITRINQLARARRERPIGFMPAPEPQPEVIDVPMPPSAEAADTAAAAASPNPAEAPVRIERPALSVAPVSANVVPFRQAPLAAEPKPPSLSPVERKAFRELAQELTARLRASPDAPAVAESSFESLPAEARQATSEAAAGPATPDVPPPSIAAAAELVAATVSPIAAEARREVDDVGSQRLFDRIPIGVLVYRHDSLIYANRHFLEMSGYDTLDALAAAGGLNSLFVEPDAEALAENGGAQSLSIMTCHGDKLPVDGRLFTIPWNGASALVLILTNGQGEERRRASELALAAEREIHDLKSILDTTTDGVVTLDQDGRVVDANSSAATLFNRPIAELNGQLLGELFTAESGRVASDFFGRIVRGTHTIRGAIDVEARAADDRLVPLTMTIARVGGERFCAVFRDATASKKSEEELRNARRELQKAAAAKAEFLAKVSHEIRTPLNAIAGFAEVIMAERFGPIGNERYREYLKDIHAAGNHLVSLLNDLLDLSKIETGQLDLTFVEVNLNDLTQQCVAIMQPQANRARIIIRTALTPELPLVVADERSLRQIVLNLLANSIRFTGPGGQVIVSTAFSDGREVLLRVRDTGVGMSEKDIAAALEPFRQTATSGSWGSGGTGLGLPLTKALAEANRANFSINSAPNAGTLVEVAFPPSQVVAQ